MAATVIQRNWRAVVAVKDCWRQLMLITQLVSSNLSENHHDHDLSNECPPWYFLWRMTESLCVKGAPHRQWSSEILISSSEIHIAFIVLIPQQAFQDLGNQSGWQASTIDTPRAKWWLELSMGNTGSFVCENPSLKSICLLTGAMRSIRVNFPTSSLVFRPSWFMMVFRKRYPPIELRGDTILSTCSSVGQRKANLTQPEVEPLSCAHYRCTSISLAMSVYFCRSLN